MAVLVAPWLGLLLGLGFAWFSTETLSRSEHSALASPALLLASAFGLLILGPATAYFLAYAPDWSFAYLIDSQRLPATIEMLALLLTTASPTIGFVLFARPASRREGSILLRWALVLLVVLVALVVGLHRRFATEANFAQYHGSFGTRSIAGGRLGFSLLWMNAVVAVTAGWVSYQLKRLGKKTRN
jgi:hypothetical protein